MNTLKRYEFLLKGLDCANCANRIQTNLAKNENYKNVNVNFNTLKLILESELEGLEEEIAKKVISLEPDVEVINLLDPNPETNHLGCKGNCKCNHSHEGHHNAGHEHCHCGHDHNHHHHDEENEEDKKKIKINYNLLRVALGVILVMCATLIKMPNEAKLILIVASYTLLLFRTFKNALKLLRRKVIDENFLVVVSCIGAFFIDKQFEGLMVIILYEIGKYLEDKAVNNTRKSIASLMDIKPEYANLKHEHHEHKVDPQEINVGDVIVVKQGEKVPLDGVVVKGEAALNTSSLTGESKLRDVVEGNEVLSGSINEKGLIEVKVTKLYKNSTVSKILELVENATDKKAKTENFVNRASRVYTPIVVTLAILVAILLPLFGNVSIQDGIYRALIFLVVSCPCAIVISVPLSYFTGIGKASKKGVLIKGSDYLDAIKDIKQIAFDKTGTLTKGTFAVESIDVIDNNYSKEDILKFAAIGESNSNHPIALAIINEHTNTISEVISKEKVEKFEEISGKGLRYSYEGKDVKVGNNDLVGSPENDDVVGTIVYVSVDDKVIGSILLNDILKEETIEAITRLKKMGISTKMFTGDNSSVALKVAKEIGLDEVKAEMLPQDKYNELEKMIANNKGTKNKVAFVGDGINDSPVLALSDVGISMGGIGASSAIEASDVVIMTDDLTKIADAIKISKKTDRIIKENLIFALGIKLLVLVLSVFGVSTMWEAVFADVGVTLITILNTMRILRG